MKTFFVFLVVIAVLLAGTYGYLKSPFANKQTQACLVTSKESTFQPQENQNQYRLYTSCGTFIIEDSIMLLRFDSADLYGSIQPQQTYTIVSGGFRIPFLSLFPNIISVTYTNTQTGTI